MPSHATTLSALAAIIGTANAAFQGFNFGSTFSDGTGKAQADFESEFTAMQALPGTNGAFNSARLYTMIQSGTPNSPISAIPAAIKTKTTLLLGLWASAGDDAFNAELQALQNTISQYCDQLDGLVAGISVGSEDLYRISPIGIANGEFSGANPDTLIGYISRVRQTIQGTCLSAAPIGHVDTWTAYDNSSNSAVVQALDWVGMDAYAYFESTVPNAIDNAAQLFQKALGRVQAAAGGRDIWVTETGWPVSGKNMGLAVASPENAMAYWQQVGCSSLFGVTNTWWYTLQDSAPNTPNPSFGVLGSQLGTQPLYDLSCNASGPESSSVSSSATTAASSSSTVAPPPPPPPAGPSPDGQDSSSATSSQNNDDTADTATSTDSPVATDIQSQDPTTTAADNTDAPTTSDAAAVTTTGPPADTTIVTSLAPSTTDGSAPSSVPQAGSERLNSLSAAFAALVMAVGLL